MKSRIILILMLIFLVSFKVLATTDCTQVTEISQLECKALIALYDNTDGPNWYGSSGWNVTNIPCSWYGVFCVSGHVYKITLSSNRLRGLVPAKLRS